MSIRITPVVLALLLLPVVGLIGGLIIHPGLWVPTGVRHTRPALLLVGMGLTGLIGWFASHSDHLRTRLATSGWHRFQYVQSSPGQAAVAIVLIRGACLLVLWGAALLALLRG